MDGVAKELRLHDIEVTKQIGDGAYGLVFEVMTPHGPRACKFVPDGHPRGGIANLNEIDIQRRLKHPHILPIEKFIRTSDGICLLMPLCRPLVGSSLTLEKKIEYCFKLASAVQFLHQHGIGHLDIKAENVVITDKDEPALVDFGMSQYLGVLGKKLEYPVITLHYRPPELLHNPPLHPTTQADVWSLGLLFIVLITGKIPFTGLRGSTTEWDMRIKVQALFYYQYRRRNLAKLFSHLDVSVREPLVDLVYRMTDDVENRIPMTKVLSHQLFSSMTPVQTEPLIDVPKPLKLSSELIDEVIVYAVSNYWKCHAECFLLGISLISRVKEFLPWSDGIIHAALWMAAKMTGDWCHEIPDRLNAKTIRDIESQIVILLDGILYPHLENISGSVWSYLRR